MWLAQSSERGYRCIKDRREKAVWAQAPVVSCIYCSGWDGSVHVFSPMTMKAMCARASSAKRTLSAMFVTIISPLIQNPHRCKPHCTNTTGYAQCFPGVRPNTRNWQGPLFIERSSLTGFVRFIWNMNNYATTAVDDSYSNLEIGNLWLTVAHTMEVLPPCSHNCCYNLFNLYNNSCMFYILYFRQFSMLVFDLLCFYTKLLNYIINRELAVANCLPT